MHEWLVGVNGPAQQPGHPPIQFLTVYWKTHIHLYPLFARVIGERP
jgi:hypothetical protein